MISAALIKDESFHRIPAKPVMICVLELVDGTYAVGHHISSPTRFDEEIAEVYARRRAEDACVRMLAKREERNTQRGGSF